MITGTVQFGFGMVDFVSFGHKAINIRTSHTNS